MNLTIKEKLLNVIDRIVPLDDYGEGDCIFSIKYSIPSAAVVYILLELSKDFGIAISDELVDALEMCTFGQLEEMVANQGK